MSVNQALSGAARSCWAKSPWDRATGAILGESLSLARHLSDTMAIAEYLWDEFLPEHVKELIGRTFGGGAQGRAVTAFLAGAHDCGKASAAFAVMAPRLAQSMAEQGLTTRVTKDSDGRLEVRHEVVGYLAMSEWLMTAHGFDAESAKSLAMVIGGHHGAPPGQELIAKARKRADLRGEGLWQTTREEFLAWAAAESGALVFLESWAALKIPQGVQAALCGIVIIADWVASNEHYFPLDELEPGRARADRAWRELGLPGPWHAAAPPADPDAHLRSRFTLPDDATARPLQRAAREAAERLERPALMIIEAAMGDGKTEAAWLATEILARHFGLGGVYDALPTQATSNAIFHRMNDWVSHLEAADGGLVSAFLAHNKRDLDEDYYKLRYPGRYPSVGIDDSGIDRRDIEAVVHSWLSDRKRGLLSSFVVGTIDQVLMMALKARHVALRHLAFAGKVMILDEVHSFDEYMNVFLDRALEWLAGYEVPVIVLSATLPPARRRQMVAAYEKGSPYRSSTDEPSADPPVSAYPLITVTQGGAERFTLTPEAGGRSSSVRVQALADTDGALIELLKEKLAAGGCAVVIRNTVGRAQATADAVRASFGPQDVTLAHARFLAFDRASRDRSLLQLFGNGSEAQRPDRHIVVATQVVEQSLDLDFDLMVSDLAPMDLLLQRAGRLHRHPRASRPSTVATPALYVSGARWHEHPPAPNEGSAAVYGMAKLLRAAAVLRLEAGDTRVLRLPGDIPQLVAQAYSDELVPPPGWESTWAEAEDVERNTLATKKSNAEAFRLGRPGPPGEPLIGWIAGGHKNADPEAASGHAARGTVREGADSIEVVVLNRDEIDGMARIPEGHPSHAGAQISLTLPPPDWQLRRAALTSTIQINGFQLRGSMDAVIEALELATDLSGWDATPELRGQLVLRLDGDGQAIVGGHRFTYSAEDGMRIERA